MSVEVTSEFLSPDDAKLLVGLCRAGKLYEIEKRIASGKCLRTPRQIKKTPLRMAMDLGFHSLIELLVRHEDSQAAKNQTPSEAVSRRRLDVVELLLAHGAELRSVPPVDALPTWESAPCLLGRRRDRAAPFWNIIRVPSVRSMLYCF